MIFISYSWGWKFFSYSAQFKNASLRQNDRFTYYVSFDSGEVLKFRTREKFPSLFAVSFNPNIFMIIA